MIRLLALDMDGTCLNGRSRMTEETIRTIRKAADASIDVSAISADAGERFVSIYDHFQWCTGCRS